MAWRRHTGSIPIHTIAKLIAAVLFVAALVMVASGAFDNIPSIITEAKQSVFGAVGL